MSNQTGLCCDSTPMKDAKRESIERKCLPTNAYFSDFIGNAEITLFKSAYPKKTTNYVCTYLQSIDEINYTMCDVCTDCILVISEYEKDDCVMVKLGNCVMLYMTIEELSIVCQIDLTSEIKINLSKMLELETFIIINTPLKIMTSNDRIITVL